MASSDAGLSNLVLSTYSNYTYYSTGFNGSAGNYLSVPNNTAFQFGSGSFTIEVWLYCLGNNGASTYQTIACMNGVSTSTLYGWLFSLNPSLIPTFIYSTNGTTTTLTTFGNAITTNQWNHLAVSCSGTTLRAFLNGTQIGSNLTISGAIYAPNTPLYIGSNYDSTATTQVFYGYLSNLRIDKGQALYTTNFTPSTSQFTTTSQGANSSNVSLLTCQTNTYVDNSTNSFTITRAGSVGFIQYSPLFFNANVALTPTFATGNLTYSVITAANISAVSITPTANDAANATLKFNGNVSLTSGSANIATFTVPYYSSNAYSTNFVSGMLLLGNAGYNSTSGYAWTIEMWVNVSGNYTSANDLFAKRVGSATTTTYEGYLTATNGYISFYNGTAYNSGYKLTPNVWNHVAYTYDGNWVTIYVNGVSVYTVSVGILADNAGNLTIGGTVGNTEWLIGNVSNFRFTKGYVLYKGPFTVPTQPLGLTQSASTNVAAISGAPTNGYSGYFNGTTGSLIVPSGAFSFGTNNFTAECWVYCLAYTPTTGASLLDNFVTGGSGSYTTNQWQLYVTTAGVITLYIATGVSTLTTITGTTLPLYTWTNIAIVKNGTSATSMIIYVNGASVATGQPNTTMGIAATSYIGRQTYTNNAYFNGYITNVRVVNGTAVYTSNYSPSSTPLTAITNTQLLSIQNSLTNDASSNNYTLTNNNVALSSVFSPYNTASGLSTQYLSSSVQYLTVSNPYNPAISIGAGHHNNFTAEAWIYMTALPPASPGWYIIQKGLNGTNGLEWALSIYTNTTYFLYFQYQNGQTTFGTTVGTSSNTINLTTGQWFHIAITKVGQTVTFWFNGTYAGSVLGVNNMYYTTAANFFTIANTQTGATTAFTGYISNIRVTYGTAVYTADINTGFTPPTSILTTTQSATNTQASIGSYSSYLPTNSSSVYFNNTNDYLTFPEPTYISNDITIEAWVLLNAAPTTAGMIINNNAASTGYFGISILTARTISVYSDSTSTAVVTSASLVPLNQWTHIAVVFSNTNIFIYINGVRDANTVVKTSAWGQTPSGTMYIGRQASAAAMYFPGYISNLRMVYGTALYLQKFSVPTSPFTAITNTVFLGLQSSVTKDNSTNNATITLGTGSTGLYLAPTISPFNTAIKTVTNGYSLALGWQQTASTDYISGTLGYNTALNIAGDFTLEAWIYLNSTPATAAAIFDVRSVTTDSYYFSVTSGKNLSFYPGSAVGAITGSTVLGLQTWYHVATTRINGTISLYVNGIKESTTGSTTIVLGATAATTFRIGASVDPYYFYGYLSNIRLIIGRAIYTGNFIPSVNVLGLTSNSATNTLAVSGITTYPTATNPIGLTYSGSLFFNGVTGTSGTFMSIPNAARFNLDAYNFTIEAYVNLAVFNASNINSIVGATNSTTTDYAWLLSIQGSTTKTIVFTSYTGFGQTVLLTATSNTVTFNTNTWYHVAVTRVGTTLTFYLNGVSVGTTTLTSGQLIGLTAQALYIGNALFSPTTYYSTGYISNVRVLRGYAVYTGNFTPSTSPLSNTQNSGTNIIQLGNGNVPSLGNSVFFNGTTDYMKAPSVTTSMGTGDFTIELYYYPTSFAAITTLLGQYTATTTGLGYWNIQITTGGIITVYYNGATNFTASTAILVNEWVHIALVRISGTITLYVNGVSYGTVSYATQFGLTSLASPLFIGAQQSGGPTQYAAGYMSNLRIVVGTGVYTGAFTVPTNTLGTSQAGSSGSVSFTTAQTSLLALQNSTTTDGSVNNFTLTNVGNATVTNLLSPFSLTGQALGFSYSASLNGTNQYLSIAANSAWQFGTGDFTIECWFYWNGTMPSNTNQYTLISNLATSDNTTWDLQYYNGSFRFASWSPTFIYLGGTATTGNTWHHIAVTRSGTVGTIWLDGASYATASAFSTNLSSQGILKIGYNGTNNYWNGYISNVRVIKGQALFTGSFNVSSSSLTTTSVGHAGSGAATSITGTVSLLTLQNATIVDNSTNNFTITNVNSVAMTNSIAPALLSPVATNNGSSIAFTGSTQYITAPSNSVFTYGTGDFTIEGWIYLNSTTTSGTLYDGRTGASTVSPQIYVASNVLNYAVAGTSVITGATLSTTTWNHVAVVRISGSTKLYVNGSQSGSTYTDSNNYVIGSPYFGTGYNSSNPLNGYISNIRVVKGVGIYTTTFSVPTSPLVSSQGSGTNAITGTQTSLLLYQNSLYTDNSTFNYTVTPFGNPTYSPVFSPSYFAYPTPFNGNSGYFNGTSSYLSLTQPSNAGTGDFTIEMWIYPTSIAAIGYLLSTSTTTTNCYHLWIATTGAVTLAIDSATASITSGTPSFAKTNAWTHIAIVRKTLVIYMFVNGVVQATQPIKGTQFGDTGTLNIGRYQPTPSQYFTGYITNIRYVYGTAVYDPASYFTPPLTTPLTAITNTSLLLLQTTLTKDNSTNNVTVTNNNAILSNYTNPYTMMQLPVVLTGQSGTTGVARDNSMYNATVTNNNIIYASYQPTVSPFGLTPAVLTAQSINSHIADNSMFNFTYAPTTTVAFSPSMFPYVTPFGNNSSIAFNGSTTYVTGINRYLTLGGDFTIEFFMQAPPQNATISSLILAGTTVYATATNNNYYITCSGGVGKYNNFNTIQIYNYGINPNGPTFVGSTIVCDSKWHHIAIVRINGIVTLYVDGTKDTAPLNGFTNTAVWDYSSYSIGSNGSDGTYTVAQLAYNGLLSNFRIINGTGIYTGNFTKPNSNLTTSQTIGTNISTFTPSAAINNGYSWTFAYVASSYVTITPASILNFGYSNFTIEFYHFLNSRSSVGSLTPCFFSNFTSVTAGRFAMYAGHYSANTSKYQLALNDVAMSNTFNSVNNIIFGKWTHIAITRNSGVISLYINGVLDSTFNGNFNIYNSNNTWYLGADGSNTALSYFAGLISNFRVTYSVVYTGNFTTPSTILATTQSSSTNISAISNTTLTNAYSVYYTGAGTTGFQYNNGNIGALNAGVLNLSVEAYVYFQAMPTVNTWTTGVATIFGVDNNNTTTGIHFVVGSNNLFIVVNNVTYGGFLHGITVASWNHVAYQVSNGTARFYVNGILIGTTLQVPTTYTALTTPYTFVATAGQTSGYGLNGYISNLRVSKATTIYNTNFTPAGPFLPTSSSVQSIQSTSAVNVALIACQNTLLGDNGYYGLTLSSYGSTYLNTRVYPDFSVTNANSGYFSTNYGSTTLYSGLQTTYVVVPDIGLGTGTGDFTVECFIYPIPFNSSTQTTLQIIFSTFATGGLEFGIYPNGLMFYSTATSTATPTILGTTTIAANMNAWNHFALVRNSSTVTLYINGLVGYTGTNATNFAQQSHFIGYSYGNYNPYTGYVSNLRITNYLAVYTSAFTPPTSVLTNTQTANTLGNPSAAITTNTYAWIGQSSNSYLTVPASAGFIFGSNSFTIEFFVYFTSFSVLVALVSPVSGTSVSISVSTAGVPTYSLSSNGSSNDIASSISFGSTLVLYTWYHMALVRNSNVFTPYINGVSGTTTTSSTAIYANRVAYYFGNSLQGYLSNVRVTNGTAVYTGAFTVPTTNLTTTQFANGNIQAINAPTTLNGYYGLYFSRSTSQNLTVSGLPFVFGTGNFTIEFYIYYSSSSASQGIIIDNWPNINYGSWLPGSFQIYLTNNSLSFNYAATNNSFATISATLVAGNWYHVAFVRTSTAANGFVIYVNGAASTTSTLSSTIGVSSITSIGLAINKLYPFGGILSNLRVSSIAVYTGAFTAPTSPLTATQSSGTNISALTGSQVTLLTIQSTTIFDNSTYNYAIVTVGTFTPSLAIGLFNNTSAVVLLTLQNSTLIDNGYVAMPNLSFNSTGSQIISSAQGLFGSTGVVLFLGLQNSITVDNSSVNNTITTNGLVQNSVKSPFPATNGNSVNFNGSGCYLYSAPNNSTPTPTYWGTSDFTVEGYIFLTSGSTNGTLFDGRTSINAVAPQIYINNLVVYFAVGGTNYITGPTISTNTWYHIAVARSSSLSTITMYVNGKSIGSISTNTYSFNLINPAYYIGQGYNSSYPTYGYISNVRVTQACIYFTNFTVPTSPLSTTISSVTSTNAQTSPSNSYGIDLFTTSSYLVTTSTTLTSVGFMPFTIEAWIFLTSYPSTLSYYTIVSKGVSNSSLEYVFGIYNNSAVSTSLVFNHIYTTDGITNNTVYSAPISLSLYTWYHVVLTRRINVNGLANNGSFTFYLNGNNVPVSVINTYQNAANYQSTTALEIGAVGAGASTFNGSINNLRLTIGQVYNYPFTPSSNPLSVTQSNNVNGFPSSLIGALGTNYYGVQGSFSSTKYLSVPGSAYVFGTNPFTIECWCFITSSVVQNTLIDNFVNSTPNYLLGQWQLYLTISTQLPTFVYAISTSATSSLAGSSSIPTYTWTHIAVVRTSTATNGVQIYVNGVSQVTGTISQTIGVAPTSSIGVQTNSKSNALNGNITNVRTTYGVAVYTTAFTPSILPFTTTQVAGVITSQASFLGLQTTVTGDISQNSLTLSTVGSPTLSTSVSPFTPITNTGYSVNFGGTGNYLTLPSSGVFAWGVYDFTVEGYIYISSGTTGTLFDNRSTTNSTNLVIYINSSRIYVQVGNTVVITGSTLSAATWYHVAYVRINGLGKLYVNGTQVGSTYGDAYNYNVNGPLRVGSDINSTYPLNGYISNLRVLNGTGYYTTTFTPSTVPLSSNIYTGSNPVALTAPITSNGYYTYNFNGSTTQYLSLSGAPFTFGTNAFTVECWVYVNSLIAIQTVIDNFVTGPSGSYTANQWQLIVNTTGTIAFIYATSTSATTSVTTTSTVSAGTWAHIAVVRTSTAANGFVIYVNGAVGVTGTVSQSIGVSSTSSIGITTYNLTLPFTGLISNIRVTNIAVYTGAFTVPTSPLATTQSSGTNISAISGTQVALLTAQSSTIVDNSTNTYTITNNGTVISSIAFGLFGNNTGVQLLTAQNATAIDNSVNQYTVTNVGALTLYALYGLFNTCKTQFLPSQSTFLADASTNNLTLTSGGGNPLPERTNTPFGTNPSLLWAQSGLNVDNGLNSLSLTPINAVSVFFNSTVSPFGTYTPVALLTMQSNVLLTDNSSNNFFTSSMTNSGSAISVNTVNGPFNNETGLLALQNAIATDISNNRTQMTVANAGVSPSDNGPFVSSSSVVSFLATSGGFGDTSISNAIIGNSTTAPQANATNNPFIVPSTSVVVLSQQTSNTIQDQSINQLTWANTNTSPTISNLSPFGTYYSNGIVFLNSNVTSNGASASTIANIVVTAGDGITTNTYTITVTNNPIYSNRTTSDVITGITTLSSNLSTSYANISDVANSNLAETITNVTFTSNIQRYTYDIGLSNVSLSNGLGIFDVANSNIIEACSTPLTTAVSIPRQSDLFSSNIANITVTGTIKLLPTYSYTDGIPIDAVLVSNSQGSGSYFVSNFQIWYQT